MLQTAADSGWVLIHDTGILIGLWALAKMLSPQRAADRILFGCTAGALLCLYGYWRWHDTLPPFELKFASLWPHAYFLFEAMALVYTLLSIVILFRLTDRSKLADEAQAALETSGVWPHVDVFICTYNEPLDVLEKSVLSALAIDYPNAVIWVLDDMRRDWVRDYCASVGARYITRSDNTHAKAGNLNNGLYVSAGQTNAPVILVLDADFAPRSDILKRTVGLLENPDVAVVQTPQFYFNPDPVQHNLMAEDCWVDDQRFFFDCFQPAKDAWGCAFCVGTSFVVRRDRLMEIGGFPADAITEDLNLSYTFFAKGYQTWWLNERLSRGLAAEGIAEYLTQRARWCLGTIQVGLLRGGPLRGRGFSFVQRCHYVHCVLNWICKPFIILMLAAPSIYWIFGYPAFQADYLSFLRYGVPALVAQMIYMGWVSRSRTLPFFMEATHAIGALAITATLLGAIVKPFGRPFKVTDKGGDRSVGRVYRSLAAVFGLVVLFSLGSIVWAFVSPFAASEISPTDLFNLLWAGIAMFISFIAFVVCFERPRSEMEFQLDEPAALDADGIVQSCTIRIISTGRAILSDLADRAGSPPTVTAKLYILDVGWIPVTGTASKHRSMEVLLRPSVEQHRRLVVRLFSRSPVRTADRARMIPSFAGLWGRGFRS